MRSRRVYMTMWSIERLASFSVLFLAIVVIGGCATNPPQSGYTFENFVNDLHAAGARVELPADQNIDHGFSIPGRRIMVNGANVYIYEFADNQAAFIASSQVSPDGYNITRTDGTNSTMRHSDWIEPPHLYRKGQLIVIYAGRDGRMRGILESLLGSQFAGSETNYRGQ